MTEKDQSRMEAEYYSEKSIAVFGETKPWLEDMKRLGGKFNGSLRGRPGWIFSRQKEAELMQFLAAANAGLVTPTPTAVPAQLVTVGATPMAMTPQAALARLQTVQPMTQGLTLTTISPLTPAPMTLPLPTISPLIPLPPTPAPTIRPLVPAPATRLPTQPTTATYPNLFMAADGLAYQIVMYTVPMPTMGQRVTLTLETEMTLEYTVTRIEKTTPPFDSIVITRVAEPDAEPNHSRAVLVNGVWKINGMQDEHTLTFLPEN